MRESQYQNQLINKLKRMFDGCVVLKNDASYLQGFPDLLVLFEDKWAALEVKASGNAAEQPNQAWWVETLDGMSFSAFIYPGNEKVVLSELQRSFGFGRQTRVS